jgi:hypothetical protein
MIKLGCRGFKEGNKIAIDLALSLQEKNLQTLAGRDITQRSLGVSLGKRDRTAQSNQR